MVDAVGQTQSDGANRSDATAPAAAAEETGAAPVQPAGGPFSGTALLATMGPIHSDEEAARLLQAFEDVKEWNDSHTSVNTRRTN